MHKHTLWTPICILDLGSKAIQDIQSIQLVKKHDQKGVVLVTKNTPMPETNVLIKGIVCQLITFALATC